MKFFKKILTGFLVMYSGLFAFPETLAPGQEQRAPWSQKVSSFLGCQFFSGNQEAYQFNYSLGYEVKNPSFLEFKSQFQGTRGEEKEKLNRNRHAGSLNLDFLFQEGRYSVFYLGQGLTDQFRDIRIRSTQGIGFRYKPVDTSWLDASISAAPVWDYEKSWDGAINLHKVRWSIRPRVIFFFDAQKENEIRAVLFYLPLWNHFEDYRIDLTFSLKLKIAGIFFLDNRWSYEYDSHPMEKILKSDYRFTSGIGFQF